MRGSIETCRYPTLFTDSSPKYYGFLSPSLLSLSLFLLPPWRISFTGLQLVRQTDEWLFDATKWVTQYESFHHLRVACKTSSRVECVCGNARCKLQQDSKSGGCRKETSSTGYSIVIRSGPRVDDNQEIVTRRKDDGSAIAAAQSRVDGRPPK